MSYFSKHGFCLILICLTAGCRFAIADSTDFISSKFRTGISFAFLNSTNWSSMNSNSISFSSELDYTYSKSLPGLDHFYNLKFELGFTRFADSIWLKHADGLQSQYIFKLGKTRISQSANSLFTTKFLNNFNNPALETSDHNKTSGSFVPSALELGYGAGFKFFGSSFFNLSLATARFRLLNAVDGNLQTEGIPLSSINDNRLYFDYGFSLQYYIEKELNSKFEFHASGNVFLKSFHRNDVEMNLTNWLKVKLSKYFQIRLNINVVYAPLVSYNLQLRNELLMGFYFETEIKK